MRLTADHQPTDAHGALEPLLARAMLWRWVGWAFWYPEADFLQGLRSLVARQELDEWGRASGSAPLAAALGTVWAQVDGLDREGPHLPEEHTHLFGRQVLVSPHETGYAPGPGADRAQALAEIAGLYAAFGFQTSAVRPELPDHVSAESEFVAALLAKEVYAEAQGWAEQAELARAARARFVAEHPAQWLPAFAERLGQHARLAFYPAAVRLALALLEAEEAVADGVPE